MKSFVRSLALSAALVAAGGPLLACAGVGTSAVYAWSGARTAQYADAHWNDCKNDQSLGWTGTPPTYSSDGYLCFGNPPGFANCNAFASEALNYGGYSYVNIGGGDTWYWNLGNESARGIRYPNFSRTFANAPDFWGFLTFYDHDNHNGTGAGGGTVVRVDYGVGPAMQYDELNVGDLLFMALYGGGTANVDHTRVEIGWYSSGATLPHPTGFYTPWWSWVEYGDYADNQSPGRYHDFWNGFYAEQQAGLNPQSVNIWEVTIDTRNV